MPKGNLFQGENQNEMYEVKNNLRKEFSFPVMSRSRRAMSSTSIIHWPTSAATSNSSNTRFPHMLQRTTMQPPISESFAPFERSCCDMGVYGSQHIIPKFRTPHNLIFSRHSMSHPIRSRCIPSPHYHTAQHNTAQHSTSHHIT